MRQVSGGIAESSPGRELNSETHPRRNQVPYRRINRPDYQHRGA
jgi:hypothetical protein